MPTTGEPIPGKTGPTAESIPGKAEILDINRYGGVYGRLLIASQDPRADTLINPAEAFDVPGILPISEKRDYNPITQGLSSGERAEAWKGIEFNEAYRQWRTKLTQAVKTTTNEKRIGAIETIFRKPAAEFTEEDADELYNAFCKGKSDTTAYARDIASIFQTDGKTDLATIKDLSSGFEWLASGLFGKQTATIVSRIVELEAAIEDNFAGVVQKVFADKERINNLTSEETDIFTKLYTGFKMQTARIEPQEDKPKQATEEDEDEELNAAPIAPEPSISAPFTQEEDEDLAPAPTEAEETDVTPEATEQTAEPVVTTTPPPTSDTNLNRDISRRSFLGLRFLKGGPKAQEPKAEVLPKAPAPLITTEAIAQPSTSTTALTEAFNGKFPPDWSQEKIKRFRAIQDAQTSIMQHEIPNDPEGGSLFAMNWDQIILHVRALQKPYIDELNALDNHIEPAVTVTPTAMPEPEIISSPSTKPDTIDSQPLPAAPLPPTPETEPAAEPTLEPSLPRAKQPEEVAREYFEAQEAARKAGVELNPQPNQKLGLGDRLRNLTSRLKLKSDKPKTTPLPTEEPVVENKLNTTETSPTIDRYEPVPPPAVGQHYINKVTGENLVVEEILDTKLGPTVKLRGQDGLTIHLSPRDLKYAILKQGAFEYGANSSPKPLFEQVDAPSESTPK